MYKYIPSKEGTVYKIRF